MPDDNGQIDALIGALYEVISFDEGGEHFDGTFSSVQAELDERMAAPKDAMASFQLLLVTAAWTPIFMVQFEARQAAQRAIRKARERGYSCAC